MNKSKRKKICIAIYKIEKKILGAMSSFYGLMETSKCPLPFYIHTYVHIYMCIYISEMNICFSTLCKEFETPRFS